jgi:hypothetical protein
MSLFDFMFHSVYDRASLAVMAIGLAGHAVFDYLSSRRNS